jgi:hypothetical protein
MTAARIQGASRAAASTGSPGVPVEMYPQSLYNPSRYTDTWCGDNGGTDGGEGRSRRLRPGPAAQVAAGGAETPCGREHHEGRAPGCRRPLPQLSRDRGKTRAPRSRGGAAEGVVVDTRTEVARMKILALGPRGSSCELTSSPSRARLQGFDQPITEAVAVEQEPLQHDANTFVRTGFSKPFSIAKTTFSVTVFAGGKKVVRR